MNWYKKAQLNKEAFKMNLLFDFYLIASLPKDKLLYLLNTDEDFKYYIVKKLDYIKHQYIQDGIKQVNKELKHKALGITGVEELPKAANWFNNFFVDKTISWGSFYGGPAWGKVASALYDIAVFPDFQDLINQNISNNYLVETIYLLIKNIDYFNDLAHNSGLALNDMVSDSDVRAFLDYKRDYEVRALARYYSVDSQLLRATYEPFNNAVLDLSDAKQIIALLELGYTDLIEKNIKEVQQIIANSGIPEYIYKFALWLDTHYVPGVNEKLLENALIKTKAANYAYLYARTIEDEKNISALQQIVLDSEDLLLISQFAQHVHGAYVPSLEDAIIALGEPLDLFYFAKYVKGANKDRLYKVLLQTKDKYYIKRFQDEVIGENAELV